MNGFVRWSINYHISIRIFDNGQPLFLQRLSGMDKDSRTDSDRLFGQIADIAAQKYHIYPTARECGSRLSHHAEFSIKEQTQPSSYAGAAVIPRKNGQLGILIWHPLTQIQSRIVRQRWFFLLADPDRPAPAFSLFSVFYHPYAAAVDGKPRKTNAVHRSCLP